ncbi:MAG: HflC protein [Candidatus Dactylopiibacterium carminicum]|uniref:Protein HflC n=1 Tax=Candidatus Dactylopiibacterium carminicum TaxID=857335 RepID=A0A272EZ19_9RHOO|nr:protease modulator HflC [Candidatus Dactylopiibacterium carminicum]KAF7600879.1 protease modulator HflC [Candidatus Dactylopiibacterium carminicum]PAS95378.1 MAG: HflC protein [Candidatus Dactylopiibacterium carminicum]PAS98611.1 MAG: HflC protein [Candidatus Dactylopiibacterium carminicum]PAT00878.1 MAG: HflC protein [Candidatus Dactylopiibacterium carminicum]
MNARLPVFFGGILLAVAVLSMSLFTVDQRRYALVFQLGEIKRPVTEAGLYFKLPMIQNVQYYDARILTLDSPDSELFQTAEKKNVLVDSFTRWRIGDPSVYYRAFGMDEPRARNRLSQTVNAVMREEFGKRQMHEVISGERQRMMEVVRERSAQDAVRYGVQIVDVRVKRVELPSAVSDSVYGRMEAERKRVANELRATGGAEAEQIRAEADRRREVIVAEAYRDAQVIKGEGDAKAAAIYAEAFGRSPEFFRFWRSMEAYKQTFNSKSDMLVVDPSSDFFKYLKNSGNK